MATAEEYASWIVKNADKKGSPEFETVAQAYQLAKQKAQPFKRAPDALDNPDMAAEGGISFRPLGFDTGLTMPEGVSQFLAGAGKKLTDMGRGTAQIAKQGPSAQEVDALKLQDAPLMKTTGAKLGGVAADIVTGLPLAFVPGANTYKGAAIVGGLMGALDPVGTGDSRGTNTALGAAGGFAGQGVANGISRVLNPQINQQVKTLMAEGVSPTPGQVLGGGWKALEDKATSIPILGGAIKSGQMRTIDDFNRAAYNRVLAPIGENAKDLPIGREGVAALGDKLSAKYDALLPTLKIKADSQYHAEMSSLKQLASNLGPQQEQQFNSILKNEVERRFSPNGGMAGETMKEADSSLGAQIRRLSGSSDANQRGLADALKETQAILRDMVERNNPAKAAELSAINQGWANLTRVERSAASLGAREGVVTPAQLTNAVKAGDTSVRKRQFARGNALMQDLAESGKSVLGDKYPDSGTAGRLLLAEGGLGLGSHLLAGTVPILGPGTMAAAGVAALGTLPYTTGVGQKAAAALLAKRYGLLTDAGELVRNYAPAGATAGAGLLTP